jgi:hypothetical protein
MGDDMAAEVSETGFRIVLISLADGRILQWRPEGKVDSKDGWLKLPPSPTV